MTKDEFRSLARLEKKDFIYREWVALVYAREWTFLKGNDPAREHIEEFEKHYSPAERARIRKLMRMMLFANYCGNAFFKRAWKTAPQACEVSFGKPEE
jgi:hypothetical protein